VTISVLPCSPEEIAGYGAVRVDEDGRIVEFREKPADAAGREGMQVAPLLADRWRMTPDRPYLASMGHLHVPQERAWWRRWRAGDRLRPPRDPRLLCATAGTCAPSSSTATGGTSAPCAPSTTPTWTLVRPSPPFNFNDPEWPFYTHPRYLPGSRLNGVRVIRSILSEGRDHRGLHDRGLDHRRCAR
jgi:glucose-1-phosphate adenylyltransferase